jgi:hypothetical protein
MSHNRPKSLSELVLRPGSPAQVLAERAAEAQDLAATLRQVLPPELAAVLRSASLAGDGTLVVTATSPAWASRLRFESDKLLAAGRALHPAVERLKVRVGRLAEDQAGGVRLKSDT